MRDKDKIKSGMIAAGVSPKTADEILSSPAFDRDPEEIEKLRAERDSLKALLKECADDLEAEIINRYGPDLKDYPSAMRKREQDLSPVVKARAALGEKE